MHRKWGGRRIQFYRRVEDRYWNSRNRMSTRWKQSWGDRFIRKHRFEVIDRHNLCPGAYLEAEELVSLLEDQVRTMVHGC